MCSARVRLLKFANSVGSISTCALLHTTLALLFVINVKAAERPLWSSDRSHRILIEVPPQEKLSRPSDDLVARVHVDFAAHLGDRLPDLSSLQIVRVDAESGEPMEYVANPHPTTKGDRPLRFYDDSIAWDFQEHEGVAHVTEGKGTPIRNLPGGARFFNPIGEGKSGHLAWMHTQDGQRPSTYTIYFNTRSKDSTNRLAPAGFTGDGANRCTPTSKSFAPVLQGRVGVADLNDDGLFDLVVGNLAGTVLYYENIGEPAQPRFGPAQLLMTDENHPIDVGWSSGPVATDLDKDGKLDLVVGAEKECFVLFRNVGDAKRLVFHNEGLVKADGKPLLVPKAPCNEDPNNLIYLNDYNPIPEIVDWDGDGDEDLLAGGYVTGLVWYYENVAEEKTDAPLLTFRGALQADGKDLDVSWMASPCAGDFDGDGDLDLVSGAMQMDKGGGDVLAPKKFLWYYENVGTRQSPKLTLKKFPAQGEFVYGSMGTPRAIDFNRDGRLDLIVSVGANLLLLANIGTDRQPLFDAATPPVGSEWGNAQLAINDLVDYNADGWPDLFTAQSMVGFNAGKGGVIGGPRLLQREPMAAVQLNNLSGSGLPFQDTVSLANAEKILHPSPRGDHWDNRKLADLDGDGALDILLGDHQGFVWFHRNVGGKEQPEMDLAGVQLQTTAGMPVRVGLTYLDVAPFDVLQGARTDVAPADYNQDGKCDLVVCDTFGYIRLFIQESGSPPTFRPSIEVGRFGPTMLSAEPIDWNSDGWPDILATYASGQILILLNKRESAAPAFESPEPVEIPGCFGYPWTYVADWNNDGDVDLLVDQYGYTRFVERSFIEYGYRPGRVLGYETRERDDQPPTAE